MAGIEIAKSIKDLAEIAKDIKDYVPTCLRDCDLTEKSDKDIFRPIEIKDRSGFTTYQKELLFHKYGKADDEITQYKDWDDFIKNVSGKESSENSDSEKDNIKEANEQQKDVDDNQDAIDTEDSNTRELSKEEKERIKAETGWSDEIINAIGSMEEYEIYRKAGLDEVEINGKKCLIRNDIDWEKKDAMGRTNRERAEQGLSPINKEGKVIELHHIGQHSDSPLAELTTEEHRGKGNDTVLHDKTKESEIDREAFANERKEHWEARASEGGNEQ